MKVTRRSMLLGSGGAALGLAATAAGGYAVGHAVAPDEASASADTVAFDGPRQAGIATPAQARLVFASFDVVSEKASDLSELLAVWTDAARKMTLGHPIGPIEGPSEVPPVDTGEATGLPPSGLTITVGFGPTLFTDAAGKDRFGIAAKRPAALADLPRFPGDALEPAISGGDIAIQACANDPQVAVHAIRNLARIGMGVVSVRWSQLGFGRTSSTTKDQATPRNLFGFKDGTENIKAEEPDRLRDHVWVQAGDGPDWMTGGSYVVTRKIRMLIETWDRESLAGQEAIVGRHKGSGAPLGKAGEFDEIDLAAIDDDGEPLVATTAHVRLAHHSQNNGARLLRRGYNFVDGSDGLGRLNAGLFFIAYQRDPRTAFVPVQRNLARKDDMNEYLRHVSSGLFACPPGVRGDSDYWGSGLFAA